MAMRRGLLNVQDIINYRFESISLLMLALTAAGVDEQVYDGNRKMAQLGEYLTELLLAEDAFTAGRSRAGVTKKITSAAARTHREKVANATGIAPFIRCNPRQSTSPPAPVVLRSAVSAIVCACWLDSNKDNAVACQIIWRLGIATPEQEPCLDPRELPLQKPNPLLMEGHTSPVLSNRQPSCSGGNDEDLAFLRELIAEELFDSPSMGEIAQIHSPEGLDRTAVMWEDFSEPLSIYESPGQDVSFDLQIESMLESTNLSPGDFTARGDEDSPFENLTQAKDGHQSRGSETKMTNAEGSLENAERENTEIHSGADRRHDKSSYGDNGHEHPMMSKPSLETSGPLDDVHAVRSTGVSRRWKSNSVTHQGDRFNPMKVASKRNGANERRQNITKTGLRGEKISDAPLNRQMACLEAYIAQHRASYETLGLLCPSDIIDSEQTMVRLTTLQLGSRATVLRVLRFAIAGCESLFGLKEVLRAYRDPDAVPAQSARGFSNAKRLETIQSLGGKEAYLNLLKKCHIYRLFADNVDPLCSPNDDFIVSTVGNVVETQARGQMGNPRNSAESRITKSIMKEVYPEVHAESYDYLKRYREITGLRRSGRRLDVLVSHFGWGILGLLPLAYDDSNPGLPGKVTETMISCLPDDEFKNIVCVLDEHKGVLLREICDVAAQIVDGVFHRTLGPSTKFVIENAELTQIMEAPKGSSSLLNLLSQIPTSLPPVPEKPWESSSCSQPSAQ